MVIGRTDDNDVVVNHRSISRHHARVLEENGRYTIVDLQSANGVRVNGEEYGKVELRKGDLIDLGHVRLRFVGEGEAFVLKDTDIVDPGKIGPSSRGGWWVAIALIAVVGVAVLLWKLMSKPPDKKPQGQVTDTSPGTKQGSADQTDLLSKINTALESSAWDQAIAHCDQLVGDAKTNAKDRCDRARAESAAKKLFDKANAAATKNEHKRALELFSKILKTSQYHREMESGTAFKQARKNYRAQGVQQIEEKIKNADCDGAAAVAAEVKKLLPEDAKMLDGKAAACPPAVAVVTKTPKGKKPKIRRPRPKTKTKPVKVTKVPVKKPTGPTPEEIEKAKENRTKMWNAYRNGYHQRALTFARAVLKVKPRDQEVLSIFGAAACHLRRKSQALYAFNKLNAQRRTLLRQVCERKGVRLK